MSPRIVSALILALSLPAFADPALIREVETLRDSLALKDASRPALTVRLADMIFDESLALAGKLEPASQSQVTLYRERAIQLYQEALAGAPGGRLRWRLVFQLARLHADLGHASIALPLWKQLLEQADGVEYKREAALRLGEAAEQDPAASGAANAEKYYALAMQWGQGTDVEAYAHYRLAWMAKRQGRLGEAIAQMNRALFDSKGQTREEALRDLITFYGGSADAKAAIAAVEALAEKLARPRLLLDLADALLAGGNQPAGTLALATFDARSPSLRNQSRLLEAYYGARRWEDLRALLGKMASGDAGGLSREDAALVEENLRRVLVQLDAERVTDAQHGDDFQRTVGLYLRLFPQSPHRLKMALGAAAAEKSPERKMKMLGDWIGAPEFRWTPAEISSLSEARAEVARGAKAYGVVVEEMDRRLSFDPPAAERRGFRFLRAAALFDLPDFERALAELEALAEDNPRDAIAVKSERLVLQILAQQKKYGRLYQQASAWLSSGPSAAAATASNRTAAREWAEIVEMKEQSEFEAAVAEGSTPAALDRFYRACQSGRFLPRSCENARVLALQLKDEARLIAILKAQRKETELAAEYESAGFFAESARLWEKLQTGPRADVRSLLRGALLHELAGDRASRDRLLDKAQATAARQGRTYLGEQEDALLASLHDARRITEPTLSVPWNAANRCRVADELERQRASASLEKILRACPIAAGPGWAKAVLSEIGELARLESSISFHGVKSRQRLEARLAALQRLNAAAERYGALADAATKAEIAATVAHAHRGLAEAIRQSPLPTGDTAAAVRNSLEKMAAPFLASATQWDSVAEKSRLEIPAAAVVATAETESLLPSLRAPLEALHQNPSDSIALRELESTFTRAGQSRLAAYFEGRLRQLRAYPENSSVNEGEAKLPGKRTHEGETGGGPVGAVEDFEPGGRSLISSNGSAILNDRIGRIFRIGSEGG